MDERMDETTSGAVTDAWRRARCGEVSEISPIRTRTNVFSACCKAPALRVKMPTPEAREGG